MNESRIVRLNGSDALPMLTWPSEMAALLAEAAAARVAFHSAKHDTPAVPGYVGPLEANAIATSNACLDAFAAANGWKRRTGTPTDYVLGKLRMHQLRAAGIEHADYLVPIQGNTRVAAIIAHLPVQKLGMWREDDGTLTEMYAEAEALRTLPRSIGVNQLPLSWSWCHRAAPHNHVLRTHVLRADPAFCTPPSEHKRRTATDQHPWRKKQSSPGGSPNGEENGK